MDFGQVASFLILVKWGQIKDMLRLGYLAFEALISLWWFRDNSQTPVNDFL